jgi:hypothetical protein
MNTIRNLNTERTDYVGYAYPMRRWIGEFGPDTCGAVVANEDVEDLLNQGPAEPAYV